MYSKGISWIDDCRIPFVDEKIIIKRYETNAMDIWYEKDKGKLLEPKTNTQGRFPANILVSDDMLNDGVVSKSGERKTTGIKKDKTFKNIGDLSGGFNDKGTNSRYYDIDKWFEKILE